MKKYASIVFMQGDEANEPLAILDEKGPKEAINFLAQWDFGTESEHDVRENIGNGTYDHIARFGDFILTWNRSLNYIGLTRIINEEDKP